MLDVSLRKSCGILLIWLIKHDLYAYGLDKSQNQLNMEISIGLNLNIKEMLMSLD